MNDNNDPQPMPGWGCPRPDRLVPDLDADGYPWDIDEDGFHWGTTDGTPYALEHSPIYPVRHPGLYQQPDWLPDLEKDRAADAASQRTQLRNPGWEATLDMEAGA
jgi:hypothetical protein